MMELAMERARRAGCYKLVLSRNEARSDVHRFYESLGFRRHGFSFLAEIEPGRLTGRGGECYRRAPMRRSVAGRRAPIAALALALLALVLAPASTLGHAHHAPEVEQIAATAGGSSPSALCFICRVSNSVSEFDSAPAAGAHQLATGKSEMRPPQRCIAGALPLSESRAPPASA